MNQQARPPEPRRPAGQRWIKRPPRPSRARPAPIVPRVRQKPGVEKLLMALGTGLAFGIFGAVVAPLLTDRPGMAGLFAGLGFAGGFTLLWRGLGYTMQDFRDMFR
jgi:hypothetical protein